MTSYLMEIVNLILAIFVKQTSKRRSRPLGTRIGFKVPLLNEDSESMGSVSVFVKMFSNLICFRWWICVPFYGHLNSFFLPYGGSRCSSRWTWQIDLEIENLRNHSWEQTPLSIFFCIGTRRRRRLSPASITAHANDNETSKRALDLVKTRR